MKLHRQSVPVLGTSPLSIDRAENRHKFSAMLDQLGIDQPAWKELTSLEDMEEFVNKVGYPVLVRPSYVLSGAAMNVCYNEDELKEFLQMAKEVSKEYPVVVSQFMQDTKEIEFDAVAQNGEVVEYAIFLLFFILITSPRIIEAFIYKIKNVSKLETFLNMSTIGR